MGRHWAAEENASSSMVGTKIEKYFQQFPLTNPIKTTAA
jgi:hypothetical protein